ncbi:MAG: Tfp pilus assembly protein PilZ [Planctomycetota bacterium]
MQNKEKIRKFIRHPTDIPIQVCLDRVEANDSDDTTLTNVSLGGLSFISPQSLPLGDQVSISIPILERDNQLCGTVIWCEPSRQGFEIGLEFDRSDDVFRLRMIEQVCHIEHYRKEVARVEGRELDIQQAANEWISLYAGDFPAL